MSRSHSTDCFIRIFSPQKITKTHKNWYLLAHNEEKDRMATFALSRFREVEFSGEHFRRREEFEARVYAREALASPGARKLCMCGCFSSRNQEV
ncbi:MAG: WYL domain-containing protein [Opitutales bacterium]